MNGSEPTLDNLAGLPEATREAILDYKLEAELQKNQGQNTQTLHRTDFYWGQEYQLWQEEKELGHGMHNSLVVLQRRIDPPRPYERRALELRAVKIIRVNEKKSKHYLRELESMIKFPRAYPNLFVQFLGWYKIDRDFHLISEYCELGDLKKYMEERGGRLPEDQVKEVSWQVLQGVVAMHIEGCVHGDIKPNNVLVIQHPPDKWWVKICDLGLSKEVQQIRGTTTTYFSKGFCPPEKLEQFYSQDNDNVAIDHFKADMWCFGELVYQALAGEPTFKSTGMLSDWCRKGTRLPDDRLREIGASEDAMDFLHSVMIAEPSKRLTAPEACEHRWMERELYETAERIPRGLSIAEPRRVRRDISQESLDWSESVKERVRDAIDGSAAATRDKGHGGLKKLRSWRSTRPIRSRTLRSMEALESEEEDSDD